MRLTDFAKHHHMYALTHSEYSISVICSNGFSDFRSQMSSICRYELIMIKHMIYIFCCWFGCKVSLVNIVLVFFGWFVGVLCSIWNHYVAERGQFTWFIIIFRYAAAKLLALWCCEYWTLHAVKCALFCCSFFCGCAACVGLMQLAVAIRVYVDGFDIVRRIQRNWQRKKNVGSSNILCFVQYVR